MLEWYIKGKPIYYAASIAHYIAANDLFQLRGFAIHLPVSICPIALFALRDSYNALVAG
jgi:hypothetical protein